MATKVRRRIIHKEIHKNIALTFVRLECLITYVPIYRFSFSKDWSEVTCKGCLKKREKK